MAASDQRYTRNYLLKANLEAKDEASATFATVGQSAEALEEKLEKLERTYVMQLELQGSEDIRREARSVDSALKASERRYKAELGLETSEVTRGIQQSDRELSLFDGKEYEAKAGLDTSQLTANAQKANRTIDEIARKKVEARARLDVAQAMANSQRLEQRLDVLDGDVATAIARVDADDRELRTLESQLNDVARRAYIASVIARENGATEVAAKLTALKDQATDLSGTVARVRAEADVGAAIGGLKLLEAAAKHIERTYHIRIDTSNLGAVQTGILSVVASGQQLAQAFESMSVSMGSVMRVAGLLRAALTILATIFAALAVAAAGPLLAALTVLAGLLVTLTAGLGLLAAAAAPLIANMAASAGAAEKQATAQNTLRNSAQALESAQRALASAEQGAADARVQAAEGVQSAIDSYNDSLTAVTQAERQVEDARIQANENAAKAVQSYNDSVEQVADAERAAADARVEAADRAAAALRSYNDSIQQVQSAEQAARDARVQAAEAAASAQRSYNDAVHQVQSSERGLNDARNQLRTATLSLTDAQNELNDAMQREPTRLAEGELNVRDAQLAQAEATNRVAEAQQRLNELDSGATSADREAAQLAIQRAQLEQERSLINLQNAQFDYNELVTEGSSELQGASQGVISATEQEEAARLGVSDAEYELLKAREDASLAYQDIAKTDADNARSIEDADRSLLKAREDAALAYDDIAKTEAENTRAIEDADRSLLRAREDSAEAYENIAKTQAEGARSIEDAEMGLAKARLQSQRAYEGIAKAEAAGARQIADADAAVLEAKERVNDALEDYNVAAEKAAQITGTMADMINKLPPALQPLAWAFMEAMVPASVIMGEIASQANDLAIAALPAIGVAAEAMALGFQTALNSIGMAWQSSGVLTSLQTILNYVPIISQAFTEGLGYAIGGLINILAISMPFVQDLAFWIRDIGLRFLEWTASEEGRMAIYRFLATAAPLIRTVGYYAWEIAKAIINWSVEHADLIAAAFDLLGRAILFIGSYIGPVVAWIITFATQHPGVLMVAAAVVGVGTAIAGLAVVLTPIFTLFTTLWSVGVALWPAIGVAAAALGVGPLAGLVIAFGVVVATILVVWQVSSHLSTIWGYVSEAASWVATNVPLSFDTISTYLTGTFIPVVTNAMLGVIAPLWIPFKTALDAILSHFGLSLDGMSTKALDWIGNNWPTVSQAIISSLPAPFRAAAEITMATWDWLFSNSEPQGDSIGQAFARGLVNGLKNINPIVGAQVSLFEGAWAKIKGIVSSESAAAETASTTEVTEMSTNYQAAMEKIQADATANMEAAQAKITEQTGIAQANGSTEMATLNTNSNTSLNDLYNNALANMQNTNTSVTGELNSAQVSGTGSVNLLNTDSNTAMGALYENALSNMQNTNTGVTSNLSTAQQGGTNSMNTLQSTGAAAANLAFSTFTAPFWQASMSVQHALNAMLYGMAQVITKAGLNMEAPTSFTVMSSVEQFTGSATGAPGGRAVGGVYDANDNPIMMAGGGKINPARTKKQGSTGGMANGVTPRVVYGEAKSEEAYVVKNRPTAEQMPYLREAASWHGAEVVPKGAAGGRKLPPGRDNHRRGHSKTAFRAMGGVFDVGGHPVIGMYGGGFWDTHWDVMPEIAARANEIANATGTSWNTYGGHGSLGGALEEYTVDFWGPAGRGLEEIGPAGDQVFDMVMSKYADDLMYIIWNGTLYNAHGQFADEEHYDHVHVSWGGAGGFSGSGGGIKSAQVRGLIQEHLPDSLVQQPTGAVAGGALANLSTGIQTDMLDAIRTKTQALAPVGGNGGPLSDEELRAAIAEGMQMGGVMPMSMLDDMVAKAIDESSGIPDAVNDWDINAINGTPSRGLFQIIEGTWNMYTDEQTGGYENVFDPVKNTAVASRIMMAQAGEVQFGAYAKGGLIREPHLGLVGEAGPEAVLPLTDHRAMAQVGDSVLEGMARGGVRRRGGGEMPRRRRGGGRGGRRGGREGGGGGGLSSQIGSLWKNVPHLITQEQVDRRNARQAAREEAAQAASTASSYSGGQFAQGTATNPSMGGDLSGDADAMEVTDSGAYQGLEGVESQMGALNEESDLQTSNLSSMGECCAQQSSQLANIDSTGITQSGQLSAINDVGLDQLSTQTGIADTGTAQYNTLTGIANTENVQSGQLGGLQATSDYQSSQLGGLQATEDYQTGQFTGLQDTATTQLGTSDATYGETQYQTGQLADIAATESQFANTTAGQLNQANSTLSTCANTLGAIADSSGPYAQAGGVTAGPGTGTSSSYVNTGTGNPVTVGTSNRNVNVQKYSNTQNTGRTQGRGASIRMGGRNAARGAGSLRAPTTTGGYNSGASALPVSDVGTQGHLAQQGQRMARLESNDIKQTAGITQLQVDNTRQTEQLGTLNTEADTQSNILGGVEQETTTQTGEIATQTGEIGTMADQTASADAQIISLLGSIQSSLSSIDSQMSGLASQIAGAMDARIAENPDTRGALEAADERRALSHNFGG